MCPLPPVFAGLFLFVTAVTRPTGRSPTCPALSGRKTLTARFALTVAVMASTFKNTFSQVETDERAEQKVTRNGSLAFTDSG
jgi:hypothetical protein